MTWNLDPILVTLGPVEIRYYGVFMAAGFLLALITSKKMARASDRDPAHIDMMFIWIVVGTIVCAHWVHLIFYEPRTILDDPVSIIRFGSGLASHGGSLGVILATYLYARSKGLHYWGYADCIAVGAMWMVVMVRLGNFMNSEIYGRETDVAWGVIFARHGFTTPRHPSQIYESLHGAVCLTAVWLFHVRYARRVPAGVTFWLVLLLYFGGRFGLEWFKEYQALSPDVPLTMGQLLSAPVFLTAAYLLFVTQRFRIWPGEEKASGPTPEKSGGQKSSAGSGAKTKRRKSKRR